MGHKNDHYTISVSPPAAGTVTPATADVPAGASIELTVRLTAAATLHVLSKGRNAPIADLSLVPR